jgi:hydrogenase maturation protein HypF
VSEALREARRIRVTGLVQGVGFRPHVWRLARETGVAGWVRNDAGGVEIAAEGSVEQLGRLAERLRREAPPLARVDAVTVCAAEPEGHDAFVIAESAGGPVRTTIGHDTAVCPECRAEMLDPAGRRWRHAFITCTHCGPRYTVTRSLPYDRPQTSLAPFPFCSDCEREYQDPADRRFHAETTCCPVCGPRLQLLDPGGGAMASDPVAEALALLRAGAIVAIKGLGGYHLACDAANGRAVARLRERKQREEKPFAVMVANGASIAPYALAGSDELALLTARESPVVLLKKRPGCDLRLPGIAPGIGWLGVMLPYTPLQLLLFHEAAGRPAGTGWLAEAQPLALVMTSANPGGEPIVRDDAEALQRLAGIADAFLTHDRAIVGRCDDSVARAGAGGVPRFIRRARGWMPRPIRLPRPGPAVLALGGYLKNTVCLTRGDQAFLSAHVGDLDNAATCAFLEESVVRLTDLLEIEPAVVTCDRHPDFHSSRLAARLAAERGLPLVAVQHHQAHIAAVAAEHGIDCPLLGLALDGVGLGDDGGIWGGELLRLDGARHERLGHLRPLALPGGDRAAREPWRMAAAALHALNRQAEIGRCFPGAAGEAVAAMLAKGFNCPPTSSAGRCFDAAAGLLGIKPVAAYEGQAAMLLEGLAESAGVAESLAGGWRLDGAVLDLLPLLAWVADQGDAARAAAVFHATLAAALAQWTVAAAETTGIGTVALGGGCFLNSVLSTALRARLEAAGLTVLEAAQAPPNDGGLSLGQAWIAMQTEF